jgi:predicted transcriptional regulator
MMNRTPTNLNPPAGPVTDTGTGPQVEVEVRAVSAAGHVRTRDIFIVGAGRNIPPFEMARRVREAIKDTEKSLIAAVQEARL